MNTVDSVHIAGFWNTRNVQIRFKKELNFLIGPNGSGKTTIINLIAAALRADLPTLYSIAFDKMEIVLKSLGTNRKPIIEITKNVNELMGNIEINYVIKEKTTDRGTHFGVESPFDERVYRDPRNIRNRRSAEFGAKLSAVLQSIVEVNWISIHRNTIERLARPPASEAFTNPIDQKVADISTKFASYFSLMSAKAAAESKSFQEQVFLSLLEQEDDWRTAPPSSNDTDSRAAVLGALRDLGVSPGKAQRSVNSHYQRLDAARKAIETTPPIRVEHAITVSDNKRIGKMLSKWRELNGKRASIYKPKTDFETIINSMFSGKELHFDERNAPVVHLHEGETVPVDILSSGEKQLFILLGEALLQEGKPVVFISDEPELSLHVKWQSLLFQNIRKLNPACQIISATHSPDIVGPFQDSLIDASECVHNV
ncbi:ATP-binding protein [Prosthecomicrobium hirschii]|uniref:ATP-binding protein n=1 Tax=Prosthecodimorpha hirschii TaxID=665126 RepID=UPI00221E3AC5|nr:ATP-binding protein [Prosthecomicrobium hirschii]MCW1843096.1 ATP-binding protein [Prosthecomicrobium hirschii]